MLIPALGKQLLTKKMAIVGSAPMLVNYSYLIDNCDLVLRFNQCKNMNINCGTKTDILCISNTGAPADDYISKHSIAKLLFISKVSEIWFPRDRAVHEGHNHQSYLDKSEKIMMSNLLMNKKIVKFSPKINQLVFHLLKSGSNISFECPSTGFMAIVYILCNKSFSQYDKTLFGFNFSGSPCHPWEVEKRIVHGFCESRSDIKIVG